jgi:predicted dehydrogenase
MVNVAVAGFGYWGKNLVRNFHKQGVLRLVCDADAARQRLLREQYADVAFSPTFDTALADPSIAAVAIATPAETHYTLATQALLAGKDVFVEKPLALTYEQGETLVNLAEHHSRILMVGHVLEYHPAIVRLVEIVRSGLLGKIRYIYSNRLSLGKVRREENILWSFAPHDIAIILRLMGSMPMQVSACGGSYVQANIADVTVTNLLFDNGVRAHIHVSWLHPFKEQRLVVIGSKKMASFCDVSKQLLLYDQRVEWQEGQPVPVKRDGQPVEFPEGEPLQLECQALLEAVASRQSPLTDGISGLRVLKVLQSAQRSLTLNGDLVSMPVELHLGNGALQRS